MGVSRCGNQDSINCGGGQNGPGFTHFGTYWAASFCAATVLISDTATSVLPG
jgi:hypothetical protein